MNNSTTDENFDELSLPIRKSIGILLLCLCVGLLSFYSYIVSIIVFERLWKVNSFYLWFISLAFGDIGVLLIYIYSTTTIILQKHLFGDYVLNWIDSVNDFFVINCYIQHPFMAFVRMAGILFPMLSRTWFTTVKTLFHIALAWLIGLINVLVVDSFAGDWGYFNYKKMSWEMSDLDVYHDLGLHYYWAAINGICVLLSVLFYVICFWKLRQSKIKTRTTQQQNGNRNVVNFSKAELNLIKVGFVLTVLFAADNILWQITQNRQIVSASGWWLPFTFTVMDISFYGMNSIMIATLSSDIQSRMCIKCFSKYSERSLVSTGSTHCAR